MSCSPFDIRDYVFGELDAASRRTVQSHLQSCAGCASELDRLQVTGTMLLSLRDEEIPRRIAFVSDKVIEPRVWELRWWQAWWNSASRLGFAAAGLLSAALVFHAMYRPAAPVTSQPGAPGIDQAAIERRVAAELDARVPAVVATAVAHIEEDHKVRLAQAVSSVEQRYRQMREEDLLRMEGNFNVYRMGINRRHRVAMQNASLESEGLQ